jgi:hypothetical protein
MKTTLFAPLLALGALAGTAVAQDANDYQAKYEKKLQKDFVSYGGWITDYDVARETAKKEGKVIFAYFSRSYSP